MPLAPLSVRTALLLFMVLACLFGWVFFLAHALGAAINAGLLPLGPLIAAAIAAAAMGRNHLKAWGRRLITGRTSARRYLLAFLAPVVILVIAVLVNSLFGAPLPTMEQLGGLPSLIPTFLVFFIAIGIGEEAGWTAFAAPLLLDRHRFLRAWLILAMMRTAWHIPLMLKGDLDLTTGVVGNFAFQFLVLSLLRRTGVWVLAAVWHTTLNTLGGEFLFGMVSGADQDRLGLLMVAGYMTLAVTVWVVDRRAVLTVHDGQRMLDR